MTQLDLHQKKVVCHMKGPLLVAAGPGSGKTRTLIMRIVHLLKQGISPQSILAVTFTNKASMEIRERLKQIIVDNKNKNNSTLPYIGTIHALCFDILRKEKKDSFIVIDDIEKTEIIRNLKKEFSGKIVLPVKKYATIVSQVKTNPDHKLSKEESTAIGLYNQHLKNIHALDYDDLLKETEELLSNDKNARTRYPERFSHVLVDEYQDINSLQQTILALLAAPQQNLFAIGDIDQSIYRFRGAEPMLFLSFTKTYPNAMVMYLDTNYRSTEQIIQNATKLIKHNRKRLPLKGVSIVSKGTPVQLISCQTSRDEAKYIVSTIEKRVGGTSFLYYDSGSDHEQGDVQFGDIAILYRNNSFADFLEKEFIHQGIPYQIIGKNPFWQQVEVRSIVLLLKSLIDPSYQEHPLITALPIDFKSLSKIKRESEQIGNIIEKSGIFEEYKQDENAQKNIELLLSIIDDINAGELVEVISRLSLLSRETYVDKRANCVRLMTLHQSKGLEFDTVFIAGTEEGYIPSLKDKTEEEIEEERRLFYVGMTRAKNRLYITKTRKRIIWGKRRLRTPSRFLDELETDNVEKIHFQVKRKRKDQIKLC